MKKGIPQPKPATPATDTSALRVGVDVGGRSIRIALCNGAHILARHPPVATSDIASTSDLIAFIGRRIEHWTRHGFTVHGVGIGVPGIVHPDTGRVSRLVHIPDWGDDFPLRSEARETLGLDVAVDNDVNAMALAEWRYGTGRGVRHGVFLTLGTGLGGALVLNGQLHRGRDGGAGEFGETTTHASIPWEPVESALGIGGVMTLARQLYAAHGKAGAPPADPKALASAARTGDPIAIEVWKRTGERLAAVLANLVWILNPERIIVGGGLAEAGDLLLDPARRTLLDRIHNPRLTRNLNVVPAALGNDAGVIGAASLTLEPPMKSRVSKSHRE